MTFPGKIVPSYLRLSIIRSPQRNYTNTGCYENRYVENEGKFAFHLLKKKKKILRKEIFIGIFLY